MYMNMCIYVPCVFMCTTAGGLPAAGHPGDHPPMASPDIYALMLTFINISEDPDRWQGPGRIVASRSKNLKKPYLQSIWGSVQVDPDPEKNIFGCLILRFYA